MKTTITMVGILFSLALILGACSDDGMTPGDFKVTVVVTDISGVPVPGLRLALVPDTPFYQDGKSAGGRPAVAIPFSVAREGRIRLAITDIAGKQVRLLGEQDALAGIYHWTWNGHDDQERHLPPGVYTAHLTIWPTCPTRSTAVTCVISGMWTVPEAWIWSGILPKQGKSLLKQVRGAGPRHRQTPCFTMNFRMNWDYLIPIRSTKKQNLSFPGKFLFNLCYNYNRKVFI